jgi:hypothetical protein
VGLGLPCEVMFVDSLRTTHLAKVMLEVGGEVDRCHATTPQLVFERVALSESFGQRPKSHVHGEPGIWISNLPLCDGGR